MKITEILTEDEDVIVPGNLYHVTFTESVPKIQAKGILPLQSSNWVQAGSKQRYGSGEIFAFDNAVDAIRWASRMDWDFHQQIGSGKISIITFVSDQPWEIDTSDPLGQASATGHWLKRRRFVPAEDIISATTLTSEMARKQIF